MTHDERLVRGLRMVYDAIKERGDDGGVGPESLQKRGVPPDQARDMFHDLAGTDWVEAVHGTAGELTATSGLSDGTPTVTIRRITPNGHDVLNGVEPI